ncbi:MAG: response regulator [Methylacidiphilales bacterium]|nr:response regulator [Candidatus Methylacidiphilales bacterium]
MPFVSQKQAGTQWVHDLNNRLAGMRLNVLLARMQIKSKDRKLAGLLRDIEAGCNQMAALLEQRPGLTASSTARQIVSEEPSSVKTRKKRGRVMLMDDNEFLRGSLPKILREVGFQVEIAPSGEACIKLFNELAGKGKKIDAFILDVKVPGGLGGIETLARLREINPEVRAIASSGYSETDVMSNYKRYGFNAALNKPFRVQELVQLLDNLIASKP